MRRFFCRDIAPDTISITGQEAKHIARVLRMEEGEKLILFDGSGIDCHGKITRIEEDSVLVTVTERLPSRRELPVNISIYQAVIKSDHMDYAVQKCTELGAFAFILFLSERCVRRPDAKAGQKLVERQQRIALEASKQCGRSRIPQVSKIVTLQEAVQEMRDANRLILFAYENENSTTIKDVLSCNPGWTDIAVVIGPEGGFDPREAGMLEDAGAKSCSLGKLILRSETAGAAAAAMIQYHFMEGRA